jgi:hypothetical protein
MEFAGRRTRSRLGVLLEIPLVPCIFSILFLLIAYWARSLPAAEASLWTVLLSAVLSSVAGFAFSPLAGAVLFQVNPDAVSVVQILLVASIAIQVYCIWHMRVHLRSLEFLPYIAGSLVTLPFGILLLVKT